EAGLDHPPAQRDADKAPGEQQLNAVSGQRSAPSSRSCDDLGDACVRRIAAGCGACQHGGMAPLIDLRVLRLLASRLCHDLIGPVAAINNGVELLGDEDPDFVRDAVALVGDSARKAAARLQFYRFVFGAGQGTPSGQSPQALAAALFDGGPILCDYGAAAAELGLEWQKLACNLLLVAGEALPRGGRLVLDAGPRLEAIGEGSGQLYDSRRAADRLSGLRRGAARRRPRPGRARRSRGPIPSRYSVRRRLP